MIERIDRNYLNDYEVAIGSIEARAAYMWCPFCGGWHGSHPQLAISTTGEVKEAPKVPEVIGKVVRQVMERETNVRFKPPAERWEEAGLIDGEPAQLKKDGDRLRVIWDGTSNPDPNNHREIVTNDGINAVYVRDLDERVVLNQNSDDPYEPYVRDTSNRYTFE